MEADVRSGYLIKILDLDLEKQLSLPISLGWVTSISKKAVSHSTVRNIIYKWKAFMRVADLSLEWTSQQIHFKVRPCNVQTNYKKPEMHLLLYRPQ